MQALEGKDSDEDIPAILEGDLNTYSSHNQKTRGVAVGVGVVMWWWLFCFFCSLFFAVVVFPLMMPCVGLGWPPRFY
jgi:hypothetical protein